MKRKPLREALVYHFIAVALVISINVFIAGLNSFVGVLILPISVYSAAMLAVRLMAPTYIKRQILTFLDLRQGEAPFDEVMDWLAASPDPIKEQDNARAITRLLTQLEEAGIIRIQSGTVRRIR